MEERAKLRLKETELSKQYEDSENNEDVPIEPYRTICEYCGRSIVTCTKKEYNLSLVPYTIIIIYFYGFIYGVFILGLTFLLFQNMTHICPECLCEITYKSFYPIKQKGKYVALTFGKCTLVVKKIIIYIILICLIIFGIYINIKSYKKRKLYSKIIEDEYARNSEKLITNFYNETDKSLNWETLIEECGAKVMIENSARAIEVFNTKYYRKIIQWKGFFINAFIQRFSQFGFYEPQHLVNINVRMIPSESIKNQDLVLSMSREKFLQYYKYISQMKTGTPIEFKAEFESIGDEWRPHHLHMISINLTDNFIKDKINVTLFKGVNFDIKGHYDIKKEVDVIAKEEMLIKNENKKNNSTYNNTTNNKNETKNNATKNI